MKKQGNDRIFVAAQRADLQSNSTQPNRPRYHRRKTVGAKVTVFLAENAAREMNGYLGASNSNCADQTVRNSDWHAKVSPRDPAMELYESNTRFTSQSRDHRTNRGTYPCRRAYPYKSRESQQVLFDLLTIWELHPVKNIDEFELITLEEFAGQRCIVETLHHTNGKKFQSNTFYPQRNWRVCSTQDSHNFVDSATRGKGRLMHRPPSRLSSGEKSMHGVLNIIQLQRMVVDPV